MRQMTKAVNDSFDGVTYLCMPLTKNVPNGHEGWKLTKCPNCGRECWERNDLSEAEKKMLSGAIPVCTECALKGGVKA